VPNIEWNKNWAVDFESWASSEYYGAHWGDPDVKGLRYLYHRYILGKTPGDLSKVVELYIEPYVTPEKVALEIGSGGGRWTRYLLDAKEIIIVELNPEFFPYLWRRFERDAAKFRFYETSGYELAGIELDHVDFVFSFGTFVHIDAEGIDSYLREIKRVLKKDGIAVIQYADKTKKLGRANPSFSDMSPTKMENLLSGNGLELLDHDTNLLYHSSIAVAKNT
jgi:SAM-dependent methyltransferase